VPPIFPALRGMATRRLFPIRMTCPTRMRRISPLRQQGRTVCHRFGARRSGVGVHCRAAIFSNGWAALRRSRIPGELQFRLQGSSVESTDKSEALSVCVRAVAARKTACGNHFRIESSYRPRRSPGLYTVPFRTAVASDSAAWPENPFSAVKIDHLVSGTALAAGGSGRHEPFPGGQCRPARDMWTIAHLTAFLPKFAASHSQNHDRCLEEVGRVEFEHMKREVPQSPGRPGEGNPCPRASRKGLRGSLNRAHGVCHG